MYSPVWVSTQLNICLFLKDEIQAYGIDKDGPVPDDHGDDINVVEVPNTLNPLQQTHYQEMLAAIDPLRPSDCHGIDIYMEVLLQRMNDPILDTPQLKGSFLLHKSI